MKILLVLAHSKIKGYLLYQLTSSILQPSLTLAQLVAITPEKHRIELVDGRYQNINYNWDGDIVGISSLTYAVNNAYEIADEFRKRGKTVVIGGYHASALPDEAKKHADSVVIGEAENSWPQLLEDFEKGEIKSFYHSNPADPKNIPPAKRILQKNISIVSRIQATRGCPNRCEFCCIGNVETHKFRKRPIENVIHEIKSLKTQSFSFDDSSLTIDLEYTKDLFIELKKINKKFTCYGNINILNDNQELIKLSKEAGCMTWSIGLESVNQESLNNAMKTNKVEIFEKAIKKIRKHGIMVKGLFIFGFDQDKLDVFHNTIKAIKKWEIDLAYFSILTPFPGSALFKRYEKEGRILTRDWDKYTCGYVVYKPERLTDKQLFQKTKELTDKFYTLPKNLKRSFDFNNLSFSRFASKFLYNNIDKTYIKMRMKQEK